MFTVNQQVSIEYSKDGIPYSVPCTITAVDKENQKVNVQTFTGKPIENVPFAVISNDPF